MNNAAERCQWSDNRRRKKFSIHRTVQAPAYAPVCNDKVGDFALNNLKDWLAVRL